MKFNEWLAARELKEYEVHVDGDGYAYDDEGNREYVGRRYRGTYSGASKVPRGMFRDPKPEPAAPAAASSGDSRQVDALKKAIAIRPNDFLSSILSQVQSGRPLSELQKKSVRQNFYRLRMKEDADLFR